ncbi:MAG: NUDIX domain-containing protein [Gammaproteobacteria bacterium]
MTVQSAGILLFKRAENELRLLLVHPGGPFWRQKDEGAWSIPKGLVEQNESLLSAAMREFREETGFEAAGEFIDLGSIRQPSGKILFVWAVEQDLDVTRIISNSVPMEWPKKSGLIQIFPEIDRGRWFSIDEAKIKIQKGQAGFIDVLIERSRIA